MIKTLMSGNEKRYQYKTINYEYLHKKNVKLSHKSQCMLIKLVKGWH